MIIYIIYILIKKVIMEIKRESWLFFAENKGDQGWISILK